MAIDPVKATLRGKLTRVVGRVGQRIAGAVCAQLSQASASFALQVLAARELGAKGLGTFALLYGSIVLGTAICTGLVGDSLTVLDRSVPRVRAGLQAWCATVSAACGLAAATITWVAGLLDASAATLFGAATAVFVVEDALRRALMAVLRFWSLPLVDGTSLVASVAVLVAVRHSKGHLTVGDFMLALLIGQLAASAIAVLRLPRNEQHLAPLRPADMHAVFAFGAWRSAQQGVRPATLTAMRLLVTLVAGSLAYGHLEAARVYMAPGLLVVNGMGSFLLPMYVAKRDDRLRRVIRRADTAAGGLLVTTLLLGAVAALAVPVLGGVITGGRYHIAAAAVFGWAVYAASTASIMPYASLAAVRGRQAIVMAFRTIEATVSLAAVAAVLISSEHLAAWAPYAMAAGPLVGGAAVRRWVLLPMLSRHQGVDTAGRTRPVGAHRSSVDRSAPRSARQPELSASTTAR